ncbi:hypothetical protein ACKGJO_02570 [Gracilimonas sp. Q87]|uniref:hypothetical protein n=1 Tax=Gracilimonas sp. Q87 TaxID=3384766 RepID=UPI003984526E
MANISDFYNNTITVSKLEETIVKEFNSNSIESSNSIWGTSICSDEINNTFLTLGKHFKAPGPFFFGGISGLPFTGKTGFAAFASHIPDNGAAMILYGPHIGISKDGTIGKVLREGQENPSSSCGSLIAGLNAIKNGSVLNVAHNDYQQGQVNKVLTENHETIRNAENEVIETTEVAFEQIKRELTDIISAGIETLAAKPLLLVGGVIINTDWNQQDQFDLRDISWFNK